MTYPHARWARARSLALGIVASATLLLAACGSSGTNTNGQALESPVTAVPTVAAQVPTAVPTPTAVETESPTAVPTPTAVETESPTAVPTPEPEAYSETSDLYYLTLDGEQLLMDVFVPAGEGPWPVVVSFHGLAAEGKDFRETVALARKTAAAGMVVFTPTWIAGDPFPITSQTFRTWDDTVSCAVAFAQQQAPEFDGDPTRTVVDGFSAGAGAALLFASQEPREAPIPGCQTGEPPGPVTGFVLGDVEAWLHSPNFDRAFASEPVAIQARQATLIGPSSWQQAVDAEFHIWVSERGTFPRPIGDPTDADGWFALRDPDGSIQADLERLDQFADGAVTYVDTGELLELRLAEAGFDVTLDVHPGSHTMLDKLPELVDYLHAAAGE